MLNKTDVSNEITGLRPKIKQAAVHIAHHLTREVSKCEKRKGDNAKKFHNRAETLRKEVLLLKEIKPDAVSRYALLMDFKDREKLLNDVNLPLKDKVMVRIATHKAVGSRIEAFRTAHPDWSSKLPQLLATLGIRAKFKKKVQKEQEKQKRKLARREAIKGDSAMDFSVESIEKEDQNLNSSGEVSIIKKASSDGKFTSQPVENDKHLDKKMSMKMKLDETVKAISVVENESTSEEEEDEDIGNALEDGDQDGDASDDECVSGEEGDSTEDGDAPDDECVNVEEGESTEDEDDSEEDVSSSEQGEDSDKDEHQNQNGKNEFARKKSVFKPSATSKFAEVRRFADLQKEENQVKERHVQNELLSSPKHDGNENELTDPEPIEEDPFFVTQENSFLKTVSVKRENGEGLQGSNKSSGECSNQNRTQWSINGQKLKGNRAERRAKFLGRDMKKRRPKEFSRDGPNSKNGFNKFNRNSEMTGDWKANKKQKVAHFEKDSSLHRRNEKNTLKSHEKFSHKDKISGNQNSKPQDSGESLHPSWEAKRKQKVSLDNFQGKKIKFDD